MASLLCFQKKRSGRIYERVLRAAGHEIEYVPIERIDKIHDDLIRRSEFPDAVIVHGVHKASALLKELRRSPASLIPVIFLASRVNLRLSESLSDHGHAYIIRPDLPPDRFLERFERLLKTYHAKGSSNPPVRVFLCYKWGQRMENDWVERLASDLRASGIEALLDKWEVRLGESFTDYMTSKISSADALLFVITSASVAAVEAVGRHGGAVKFEMQLANARRLAGEDFRIIGIYREGNALPAHLRDYKYADFRDDSLYEDSLVQLVRDLKGRCIKPPVD